MIMYTVPHENKLYGSGCLKQPLSRGKKRESEHSVRDSIIISFLYIVGSGKPLCLCVIPDVKGGRRILKQLFLSYKCRYIATFFIAAHGYNPWP